MSLPFQTQQILFLFDNTELRLSEKRCWESWIDITSMWCHVGRMYPKYKKRSTQDSFSRCIFQHRHMRNSVFNQSELPLDISIYGRGSRIYFRGGILGICSP